MKTYHIFRIHLAAILFATISTILAQDQSANDPFAHNPALENHPPKKTKSIHLYTELIEISAIQYAEIMSNHAAKTNDTALRNELLEQVKANKAKLISNQSILTRSGELATSESIQEHIYLAEYEIRSPHPTNDVKGQIMELEDSTKEYYKNSIYPETPVIFETRNIGTTLELEAILEKETDKINLRFRPEIVKHLDNRTHTEWITNNGKVKDQFPIFYTLKTDTSATLNNNQFHLISTHSPELNGNTDDTRKLLYFVKASILEASK